jgi:hypothetical protein
MGILPQRIKRFCLQWLFAAAVKAVSAGKDRKAMSIFNKLYRVIGGSDPQINTPPQFNMMYANVAANLGEWNIAVKSALAVQQQLDIMRRTYSPNEICYIEYYLNTILAGAAYSTNDEYIDRAVRDISIRYDLIDMSMIRPDLKKYFPIRKLQSEDSVHI